MFGTLFVLPAEAPGDLAGETYATPEEAHRRAWRQIDYYRSLADEGLVRLVERRSDVHELVAARSADQAAPLGLVLLMEGADPLREPAELELWTERGLRIVGPAWNATRYAGGTGMPGPLTADGRALMGELNRTGTALEHQPSSGRKLLAGAAPVPRPGARLAFELPPNRTHRQAAFRRYDPGDRRPGRRRGRGAV